MNAIETTYRGYKFRSRLEAKWACVFDQLGWKWEYEPIDLDGYIPDFILNQDILIEIKPAMSYGETIPARRKIIASGWDGEAVIFGATTNLESGERNSLFPYPGVANTQDRLGSTWVQASAIRCPHCNRTTIHRINIWGRLDDNDHILECLFCHRSYDDQKPWVIGRDPAIDPEFLRAWAHAHNQTKWARRS